MPPMIPQHWQKWCDLLTRRRQATWPRIRIGTLPSKRVRNRKQTISSRRVAASLMDNDAQPPDLGALPQQT